MIRIGTRGSKLARIQTDLIISELKQRCPELNFQIIPITNIGDEPENKSSENKSIDKPIAELGSIGVFVNELEHALLRKEVDLVVHSLKDLPTHLPAGLKLASVSHRGDPRDVLVCNRGITLDKLAPNAVIATSSRRRSSQLLAFRSDLQFKDIRGNIPTRLRKHDEGECEALVLAAAGLIRLDLKSRITQFIETDICLPAVGQGVLATECREDNEEICQILEAIDEPAIRLEIAAERAFLEQLGGGCSIPIGALASFHNSQLLLKACVSSLDGTKILRRELKQNLHLDVQPSSISQHKSSSHKSTLEKAVDLGRALAETMLNEGAESILKELRLSAPNVISPP